MSVPTPAGYRTLVGAAEFFGREGSTEAKTRWARRHIMPNLPHFQPPGTGPLFRIEDLEQYITRFRREPVDLEKIVTAVKTKTPTSRGSGGRYVQKKT